jgi:sugar lactone lactonase YvrE
MTSVKETGARQTGSTSGPAQLRFHCTPALPVPLRYSVSISIRQVFPGLLSLLFCAGMAIVSGCSAAKPQLGAISITDPTGATPGQLTQVVVNATANVSVSVSSDKPGLGVDWSLTCGGSPNTIETTNVCGTLNPVHVGSNINMIYTAPAYVPVGSTVTLTAQATTDPSVKASATITIIPQPVTLTFTTGFTPPANMAAGGTQMLAATVTNDPTAAGVNWSVSCGSASCGSFSTTLTASGTNPTNYTAPTAVPSGGTVTITATSVYDSTKSISATIAIQPVSVVVTSTPPMDPAGGPATLTATVSYDPTDSGVVWATPTCTATACGVISNTSCPTLGTAPTFVTICTATYTAPPSIPSGSSTLPVTVSAASVANPARTGSTVVTVGPPLPIAVSVAAAPATVQVNGTSTLTATVSYDYSNAGVNWNCDPGVCNPTSSTSAPFTTTFTAPSTVPAAPLTVTATSIADSTKSGGAKINVVPAILVTLASTNPTTITAGTAASFSATVSNDIAPGGLVWSATCTVTANCGTFTTVGQTPNGSSTTYTVSFVAAATAPWAQNPVVNITATSVASQSVPPVQSATAAVSVTPVPYLSFVPFAPSALPLSNPAAPATISLIAVTVNDTTNQGVDWSVCSQPTTCGQFLVAPAVPATLSSSAVSAVYASTLHAASGQAVNYLPPSTAPTSGSVTIAAASTANPSISLSQSIAITSAITGTALQGVVRAGTLPVSGASVQLYQAGNSGDGSAAFPLVISGQSNAVTTDANGNFAIPAGYTCTSPNSLLYLVATGGNPGSLGPNAQLGLMTALGQCAGVNSSASVVINEVTTVATVWALAPFTGADFTQIGSSNANYSVGLANAFATVNNIVNITTGQALNFTPAGGSFLPPGPAGITQQVQNGVVPQAEINTLADATDTCAASAGGAPGDGSACDNFFFAADVNPVGGTASRSNEPTSILAALLQVAQYPNRTNIAAPSQLFNLVPATGAPFTPTLTAQPSDWTISLSFTGGGLEGLKRAATDSSSLAIDGLGNLWIANPNTSSVSELTNLGVALSPYATGYLAGGGGGFTGGGLTSPHQLAIDPNNNPWILNQGNSLTELNPNGAPLNCTTAPTSAYCGGSTLSPPFSGGGNPNNIAEGLAIDQSGNVWVAESGTPGDVAEYAGFNGVTVAGKQVTNGNPLSPANTGYTNLTSATDPLDANPANPSGAIAVDPSGDIWLLDQANYAAIELNSQGALASSGVDHGYTQIDPNSGKPSEPVLSSSSFGATLAIDKSGDLFIPDNIAGTQMYELYSATSTACNLSNGQSCADFGKSITYGVVQPSIGTVIAQDGAGNFWVWWSNLGDTSGPAALTEFSPSGTPLNLSTTPTYEALYGGPVGFVNPYNAYGLQTPFSTVSPQSLAVDASGNIWLLFNSPGVPTSVTEYVGVATPAVTPLSLGKMGKTP